MDANVRHWLSFLVSVGPAGVAVTELYSAGRFLVAQTAAKLYDDDCLSYAALSAPDSVQKDSPSSGTSFRRNLPVNESTGNPPPDCSPTPGGDDRCRRAGPAGAPVACSAVLPDYQRGAVATPRGPPTRSGNGRLTHLRRRMCSGGEIHAGFSPSVHTRRRIDSKGSLVSFAQERPTAQRLAVRSGSPIRLITDAVVRSI